MFERPGLTEIVLGFVPFILGGLVIYFLVKYIVKSEINKLKDKQ